MENDEPQRGYRSLVAAVICQAIKDHFDKARLFGREAAMACEPARWMMSTEDRVYGCEWCCDIVGISASILRKKLVSGEMRLGRVVLSSLTEEAAAKRRREQLITCKEI